MKYDTQINKNNGAVQLVGSIMISGADLTYHWQLLQANFNFFKFQKGTTDVLLKSNIKLECFTGHIIRRIRQYFIPFKMHLIR
jgi:hypothetical protein